MKESLFQFMILNMVWIPVILLFVGVHYYIIECLKKRIMHGLSFITALLICVAIARWIYWDNYLFLCLSILYCGFFYWVLFNTLLNRFRNKPVLYLGNDSVLDRIEKSMKSPGATLGLKVVLMIMISFVLMDL